MPSTEVAHPGSIGSHFRRRRVEGCAVPSPAWWREADARGKKIGTAGSSTYCTYERGIELSGTTAHSVEVSSAHEPYANDPAACIEGSAAAGLFDTSPEPRPIAIAGGRPQIDGSRCAAASIAAASNVGGTSGNPTRGCFTAARGAPRGFKTEDSGSRDSIGSFVDAVDSSTRCPFFSHNAIGRATCRIKAEGVGPCDNRRASAAGVSCSTRSYSCRTSQTVGCTSRRNETEDSSRDHIHRASRIAGSHG